MADCDKKRLRNSTAEVLIFTGQAGEQSIVDLYNPDAIVSGGCRGKSVGGTQFRQWAQ